MFQRAAAQSLFAVQNRSPLRRGEKAVKQKVSGKTWKHLRSWSTPPATSCGTTSCCFFCAVPASTLPSVWALCRSLKFGHGLRSMFGGFSLHGKAAGKDGMSSFQALTTAVAAQVGTGNITGCATALAGGGPGAIFWMWMSAFFGMATIYAEAVLAQTFKTTVDGQVTGGPAYYIRAAFKGKFGKFLAGLLLRGHRAGAGLHGQHGPVQLHQRRLPQRLRRQQAGRGFGRRHHCGVHFPGRRQTAAPLSPKSSFPSWRSFTSWAA